MELPCKNGTVAKAALHGIISYFPKSTYCFAYGSAVFAQSHQEPGKLVDVIFVVDDLMRWHKENLKMNPSHYSAIKYLGSFSITLLQEKMGCKIYYNTYALVHDHLLKYGVISTSAFINDLENWSYMYVAGRIHKPILSLTSPDSKLLMYMCQNHLSAIRAVLLQLPPTFSKVDLYYAITELSYIGDSRMIIGENPNKVQNIVDANVLEFDAIYLPLLKKLYPIVQFKSNGQLSNNISPENRLILLNALPSNLKEHILHRVKGNYCSSYIFKEVEGEMDKTLEVLSKNVEIGLVVRQSVGTLVWLSSLRQTAVGFISTGLFGSLKYAFEKLKKGLYSVSAPTTPTAQNGHKILKKT